MSASISVVNRGFSYMVDSEAGDKKYMKASASCCIVRSSGSVILFDTMGPWDLQRLVDELALLRIHMDDVDYVVCSHTHPDHIGNLNVFSKAKQHFVGTSIYEEDLYDLNHFQPSGSYEYTSIKDETDVITTYKTYQLNRNLTIERTPGHTLECITLIVENCDRYGTVALTGDLFEKAEDINNEHIWIEAGSQNVPLQRAHRNRIYNKVDYIVPGHGQMFKRDPDVTKF